MKGGELQLLRATIESDEKKPALLARLSVGDRVVLYGYNDALVAAAVGKGTRGLVYAGDDVVVGGKTFKTYVVEYDVSKIEVLA